MVETGLSYKTYIYCTSILAAPEQEKHVNP